MNFFFNNNKYFNSIIDKKLFLDFKKQDSLLVKYYDQFKYIHIIEGKCLIKRKTKNKDLFVSIYVKSKNMTFSFFKNSPLIINILKKK
jgi:hypothetical protein